MKYFNLISVCGKYVADYESYATIIGTNYQINQNKSSGNNTFIIPSYKILAQAANTCRNLVILNVPRVNNIHASQFASGRAHKNAKK